MLGEHYKTLDWQRFSETLSNLSLGDKSNGKSPILIFDDISFLSASNTNLKPLSKLERFFDFWKCKRNPSKRSVRVNRLIALMHIHYNKAIKKCRR